MSQLARQSKVKDLLAKKKFNEKEIAEMTDPQIEYYHWLYFEDSVYDYM
ncbi:MULTISPECIES: BH0509 family protein [Bacillaceae]|uniref:BH0509 family protein n=1 Tax=Metabacillus endolithicus TaxID=1535204 RepID=A0ABW5BXP3_9BACI|nr:MULTISPECIES: BH0509 family protein [Bacillaceae]UGB28905.1 BH0509 family protein [Metabacillus sp. B2-18]UPG63957.1 BH0509 family protein [Metabacillus endolithicus]